MKIESSNYSKMVQKYQDFGKSNKKEKINQSSNEEIVNISKDYSIYDNALKALKDMDIVQNSSKVTEIAEKVENGTYEINAAKIAESILRYVD